MMTQAYGQDLRERVLVEAERVGSARAAARFEVGFQRSLSGCDVHEAASARRDGSKLDQHAAYLLGLVEDTSDITLEEMRPHLLAECGVSAGIGPL